MELNTSMQIFSVCSTIFCGVLLINSFTYLVILNIKYVDKINLICQFIGLSSLAIYQVSLFMINRGLWNFSPLLESIMITTTWQIYCNCYFIVYFRQCDILMSRKLYKYCWIYLIWMNFLILIDAGVYIMQYTIDEDKFYEIANILDFTISLLFLLIECIINAQIIYKLFNKVSDQTNTYYKIIAYKIIGVLILYLILDTVLMTLDITNNQMYACFFWGIDYSFKIQMETLCLGKLRDMIVTMEHYENSDFRRDSRIFNDVWPF